MFTPRDRPESLSHFLVLATSADILLPVGGLHTPGSAFGGVVVVWRPPPAAKCLLRPPGPRSETGWRGKPEVSIYVLVSLHLSASRFEEKKSLISPEESGGVELSSRNLPDVQRPLAKRGLDSRRRYIERLGFSSLVIAASRPSGDESYIYAFSENWACKPVLLTTRTRNAARCLFTFSGTELSEDESSR